MNNSNSFRVYFVKHFLSNPHLSPTPLTESVFGDGMMSHNNLNPTHPPLVDPASTPVKHVTLACKQISAHGFDNESFDLFKSMP